MTAPDEAHADRPYPARAGTLPRRLDAVTPEWLSGLLRHEYPELVVNDFEIVEVLNTHTTKLRLKLDLNDAGLEAGVPRDVCLKSNWSGLRTGDICEREARFYHLMRHAVDAPVPHSYFADWDGGPDSNAIVVMEDLGTSPGRFGNSTDHLGVDGVAAGLESLAVLHGSLWDSPLLDEQTWLPASMDTATDTEQVVKLFNFIAMNLEDPRYQEVMPDWAYERPEILAHVLDELAAYELAQTDPRCLVHGDSHQGNSFLRDDGQRVWLDFQLVRKGHPWRDISYFMVAALTIEERRASAHDLLRVYRDRLIATGAEGVPDQDAAWEHFRRWPGYGMQCWLGNVDQWGQSGLEMVRRFFAAAEDFDTVALLTAGKSPRRQVTLGEDALPLSPALKELRDRRRADAGRPGQPPAD